jgi:hypothetical protein
MLKLFYTIFHCESGVSLLLLEAGDVHSDNLMFNVKYEEGRVFLGFIKIDENQESMKVPLKPPFTLGVKAEKT